MINTRDDYTQARAQRNQRISISKFTIANQASGNITSMWRAAGQYPAQPAIPGAAVVVTDADPGAVPITDPATGQACYLEGFNVVGGLGGHAWIYDRLIHSGGLSGTVTTAQTVNTPALPARNGASASTVQWFVECYSDLGSTAVTATISYTNQDGTSGRTTTVAIPATLRAGRLLPISPSSPDTGILSVQSVTLSATTGTAGSFGITAGIPLIMDILPTSNIGAEYKRGLAFEISSATALWVVVQCTATSTGDIRCMMEIIRG